MDEEHPELRTYAQSQGWWTGEDEFNFAQVFSPADDHLDCCAGKDSLEKQEGKLTCPLRFSFFCSLVLNRTLEGRQRGGVESKPCTLKTSFYLPSLVCREETACVCYVQLPPVGSRGDFLFLLMWVLLSCDPVWLSLQPSL